MSQQFQRGPKGDSPTVIVQADAITERFNSAGKPDFLAELNYAKNLAAARQARVNEYQQLEASRGDVIANVGNVKYSIDEQNHAVARIAQILRLPEDSHFIVLGLQK